MFSGIVAGVAALGGAAMQAGAAKDAANTQAQALRAGSDEQAREFNILQKNQAPYIAAGHTSLRALLHGLGLQDQEDVGGELHRITAQEFASPEFQKATKDIYAQFGAPDGPNSAAFKALDPEVQTQAHTAATAAWNASQTPVTPTDAGYGALTKKFSISDFWNDPVVQASYQSGLDLGTKALKNQAPLTTGLDSGAALKELTKFGTDYTGNMAAGSQARYVGDQTNQYNRLANLAGLGQTAVQNTGAAGVATGQGIAANLTSAGNARAASQIAGANAVGGGLQSISNWWQQQNTMNRLFPQATPVSQLEMVPGQYSTMNPQYGG